MVPLPVPGRIQVTTLAITGGTGFVGQHLLRMAVEKGHSVRALTRSAQAAVDGIEWVEGALDDPASLARLAEGADAVIHVAGRIGGTRAQFEEANVTGTANMIDAVRSAGVRRFIHISSLAAREPHLSDYGWSKARSEKVAAASGLDWTIVRPPAVYGPGDKETLELFKMAKRGFVALPPPGHFSVIHVSDLCRLILALIDSRASFSQTYEPDDGRDGGWEHRHFARTLGRLFDQRAATLSVPKAVLHGASALDRLFRRGNAKLTADRVRYFCHPDWVVTAHKRPPQTLWSPMVHTPTGLKETADWYQAQGWL
ncbi:NAD(P)H-binding protein [Allosphingosinicella flava]|uniref:NAD(P)H-binding protein n=1 Tax=Allosphingosinicella flava TaxID=2771430 RepID=A0A7T2GMB5_9SPHN|nr:NAD(P)H-binding protein [Sphingosinicella flava]QPQ56163.1 NAD(P)H-binding protein [Sphingosinicella flava]